MELREGNYALLYNETWSNEEPWRCGYCDVFMGRYERDVLRGPDHFCRGSRVCGVAFCKSCSDIHYQRCEAHQKKPTTKESAESPWVPPQDADMDWKHNDELDEGPSPKLDDKNRRPNLSVVLFLRKVSLMLDCTAANVEQFISKLNRLLGDRARRHLGGDFLEDTLRVCQNGLKGGNVDGSEFVADWVESFGRTLVKSEAEKNATLEKFKGSNAAKKEKYHNNQVERTLQQAKSKLRYQEGVMTREAERGLPMPGVGPRRLMKRKAHLSTRSEIENAPSDSSESDEEDEHQESWISSATTPAASSVGLPPTVTGGSSSATTQAAASVSLAPTVGDGSVNSANILPAGLTRARGRNVMREDGTILF
jgi:hypothetical protein